MAISTAVAICYLLTVIILLAMELREKNSITESDVALCNMRLAEIERKRISCDMSAEDAEQERLSVLNSLNQHQLPLSQKIVATVKEGIPLNNLALAMSPFLVVGIVYAANGNYDAVESQPETQHESTAVSSLRDHLKTTPKRQAAPKTKVGTRDFGGQTVPDVTTMITRLAERLSKEPDDAQGWRMLGWSYTHTKNYREAAKAFARAVELSPKKAAWHAAYGEALVKANGGTVSPEAAKAFDRTLGLEKTNRLARYYKGLTERDLGNGKGALEIWTALSKDVRGNEKWLAELKRNGDVLARQLGKDGHEFQNMSSQASKATQKIERKAGPSPQDMTAAVQMAPDDRQKMIRDMVEGLARRLERKPNDVNGWIKLIRSRTVLGESAKASSALKDALKAVRDNIGARQEILAAAQKLGVEQN